MTDTAKTSQEAVAKGDEQFQAIAGFTADLELAGAKKTMQEVGAKSADLWQVPVEHLHELPNFNLRLDSKASDDHVEGLFLSMMANGFYKDKPLTGFVAVDKDGEKKVFYTDGHHRMRAARKAIANGKDIKVIPIILKEKPSIAELSIASYHSNNSQKSYTTLEIALLCLRLRQGNPPTEKPLESFQVAERLNLTKAYVETLLTLAQAPKEIRDMVQIGQVSASVAIETLRKKKENATDVLKRAVQVAEQKEAAKPKPIVTAGAGGQPIAPKTQPAATAAEKPAVTGTTTATTPAAKVEAATVKPVKVTMADLNLQNKFLATQARLAPRLFAEIIRMEKAGELKVSPELEKILFVIEADRPAEEKKDEA